MGTLYRRDNSWGIDYRDHRGRRVRKMASTDKSVAQKLLGDAITTAERLRAGMISADPREAARPLQARIDAYIAELVRRGRDSTYIYIVRKRLEGAAWAQEWTCLRDCTARSIADYLGGLAADAKMPKTVNDHRADLHAFLAWCVRHELLEANPCERVPKVSFLARKTRRALSVAECRALLDAAPGHRRIVYLCLLYTGLRRAEASALRWHDIRLDIANPRIDLPASITKSGRAESVPLIAELATALRAHRGGADEAARVFSSIPSMVLFRKDLDAAGIEHQDARGRKVVLHSLRHSLATMLAQSQVPPAVAMKIMRHRDIRLTLEAYTDESHLPAASAIATLPSLSAPETTSTAKQHASA